MAVDARAPSAGYATPRSRCCRHPETLHDERHRPRSASPVAGSGRECPMRARWSASSSSSGTRPREPTTAVPSGRHSAAVTPMIRGEFAQLTGEFAGGGVAGPAGDHGARGAEPAGVASTSRSRSATAGSDRWWCPGWSPPVGRGRWTCHCRIRLCRGQFRTRRSRAARCGRGRGAPRGGTVAIICDRVPLPVRQQSPRAAWWQAATASAYRRRPRSCAERTRSMHWSSQ